MAATWPIDFRKGHNSLAVMVHNALRQDPFNSSIFVFRAHKADRMKLFYWDDEEGQEAVRWIASPDKWAGEGLQVA